MNIGFSVPSGRYSQSQNRLWPSESTSSATARIRTQNSASFSSSRVFTAWLGTTRASASWPPTGSTRVLRLAPSSHEQKGGQRTITFCGFWSWSLGMALHSRGYRRCLLAVTGGDDLHSQTSLKMETVNSRELRWYPTWYRDVIYRAISFRAP